MHDRLIDVVGRLALTLALAAGGAICATILIAQADASLRVVDTLAAVDWLLAGLASVGWLALAACVAWSIGRDERME
jgi:hypothetical protein